MDEYNYRISPFEAMAMESMFAAQAQRSLDETSGAVEARVIDRLLGTAPPKLKRKRKKKEYTVRTQRHKHPRRATAVEVAEKECDLRNLKAYMEGRTGE